MSNVVYVLDIGMYNLGAEGQVLASTTTAWARVDKGIDSFKGFDFKCSPEGSLELGRLVKGEQEWKCGRSLKTLADSMNEDIERGRSVALGFEAPMWIPVPREHGQNIELISHRFKEEEKGYAWYLQSGAAATLKSIVLGVQLFTMLCQKLSNSKEKALNLRFTTDTSGSSPCKLVLFEAFVAGDYKVKPSQEIDKRAPNEWDAFTAALAWFGRETQPACIPKPHKVEVLSPLTSLPPDRISVWKMIAAQVPDCPQIEGEDACKVVALK